MLLSALLFLASPAMAGDAKNPEITDPAGDAGPGSGWGDLTAGWLNDSATAITMTLQLDKLPAAAPGYTWLVVATISGEEFGWGASSGGNQGGGDLYFYGKNPSQGFTDFKSDGKGEIKTGQPGTVSAELPKTYAPNATLGVKVTGLAASTGQFNFAAAIAAGTVPAPFPDAVYYTEMDAAQGKDYVIAFGAPGSSAPPQAGPNGTTPTPSPGPGGAPSPSPTATPTPSPTPQATPGIEAPVAAALLGLAAAGARRRRR
jgi:hypothetical protein